MPVRPRHVAPGALLLDTFFVEPLDRITDFAETSYLPSNLIDRDTRTLLSSERIAHALGEKHHGVMIGAVAREIPVGVAETCDLRRVFGAPRVVHDIGNPKAEKVDVETYAVFHIT
jgi:hypothetical protein